MVSATGSVIYGNLSWRPLMNQVIESDALPRSEEGSPCFGRLSGLQHDCFAQRVVAFHEPIIALMKLLDQPCRRHRKEFAAFTAIATLTSKDKVPNAVCSGHGTAF